mmetsp:Transcript_37857/g.55608  ORF Transcript_37857/g.55608 Transcript_37857/m.55608 type:complete len:106 (+) Transcript_37857:546-863(+)
MHNANTPQHAAVAVIVTSGLSSALLQIFRKKMRTAMHVSIHRNTLQHAAVAVIVTRGLSVALLNKLNKWMPVLNLLCAVLCSGLMAWRVGCGCVARQYIYIYVYT